MTKRNKARKNRRRAQRAAAQSLLQRIQAARRPAASTGNRPALEIPAAGAGAGLCGPRRRGSVGRLRGAPRRDHAVPGAGAPPGLRQRRHLLGVLLRRPLLAGARNRGRRPSAVRRRGPGPAILVRRRRQAAVLRRRPGDSGGHVPLWPTPLRRDRREGGLAGGRLLVRAGRLRPQAHDRVRSHGSAAGAAGAMLASLAGRCPHGVDGGLSGGPHGGHTVAVRTGCAGAAGNRVSADREEASAHTGRRRVRRRHRRFRRRHLGWRPLPLLRHQHPLQPHTRADAFR